MLIMGINAYHGDSSACLIRGGELVCAVEEERIRRIKHWAGFPIESIKWCLDYSGADIRDVDYVAVSRKPSAHLHKKVLRVLKSVRSLGFLRDRLANVSKVKNIKEIISDAFNVGQSKLKFKVEQVEHHRAHLASSYLVSPFEKALCVSVDGFGDFLSVMRAIGEGSKIDVADWVEFPHSLGIFYTALTQFLGFRKYGDEYKVMGLSAYGKPSMVEEMRDIVHITEDGLFRLDTSYFLHDKEGVDMVWENGEPSLGRLYSDKLLELLGKEREIDEEITDRHKDLAASMQAMYEEAYFSLLTSFHETTGIASIVLSGGCIQNSLANGKLYDKTPFNNVYIPPVSHDAGTAIGAAFWVWNIVLKKSRSFVMQSPFCGAEYNNADIESSLKAEGIEYVMLDDEELFDRTSSDIAKGKVVGWFQGRSEFGPRALGNRSILADPRNACMKAVLNERIKRREWFRPFAPSILDDFVSEWFEDSPAAPFMELTGIVKKDKKALIPAVVHADGTARLQTVSPVVNQRYYSLIRGFYDKTGVPMVLNTSFNENEPIVNTPKEAIECFVRTRMDVLVIGNFYISR